MKALLISGGGSHGSFGVAKAEHLYNNDYDIVMGWSTGALISPLAAIGEFQLLKQLYFNVNQPDIFNVNPFDKNGNTNVLNVIKRTLLLKSTLGETKALKVLIDKYYTREHFEALHRFGKEVIIATSCLSSKNLKVEYFSSNHVDFETFKLAMWASASPLMFGSIVEINCKQYTDAGAVELISFDKAVRKGAEKIDAIIHRTQFEPKEYITKVKRWYDFLGRLLPAIMGETVTDDVYQGAKIARLEGCEVNLHFMKKEPGFASMIFDSNKMTQLYYDSQK